MENPHSSKRWGWDFCGRAFQSPRLPMMLFWLKPTFLALLSTDLQSFYLLHTPVTQPQSTLQHLPLPSVSEGHGSCTVLGEAAGRCLEHRTPAVWVLPTPFPFPGKAQIKCGPIHEAYLAFLNLNFFLLLCSQSPSLSLLL